MCEPVWIRVPSGADALELTDALARFGVRGVAFTNGDGWYVRVPDAHGSAERLLDELAVVRAGPRRARRSRPGRAPRGAHLRRAPSSPPPHAA
jgi:hypothetical protein